MAKELKVKKFVVRFWEKEFNLKSDRSGGGQRYYTIQDFEYFLIIKDLLYNQGYTISGAKNKLAHEKRETIPAIRYSEKKNESSQRDVKINKELRQQLMILKTKLLCLKKLLE